MVNDHLNFNVTFNAQASDILKWHGMWEINQMIALNDHFESVLMDIDFNAMAIVLLKWNRINSHFICPLATAKWIGNRASLIKSGIEMQRYAIVAFQVDDKLPWIRVDFDPCEYFCANS